MKNGATRGNASESDHWRRTTGYRITIYIDDQIVSAFKAESTRTGIGYQTLINEALGQHLVRPKSQSQRRR